MKHIITIYPARPVRRQERPAPLVAWLALAASTVIPALVVLVWLIVR